VTLLYVVQFLALKFTTATKTSILINTCVIFTAVISYRFLKERFTYLKMLGIIIAFFGVALIVSNGFENLSQPNIGDLLMIFDGFLWAVYTTLGKVMLNNYSAEELTSYAFSIGTLLLIPFALYEGLVNPFSLSINAILAVVYLSMFCSVFAYVAWYKALSEMNATNVAVFTYLIPLLTAVLAVTLLNEEIGFYTVLGGVVVISGVYLVERK
jgi:drug/metabolite transporter (DMT)-like permease